MIRVVAVLVAALFASGCGPAAQDAGDASAPVAKAEALTAQTQDGPVRATVALAPAAPRLGDSLTLTLDVEASPGVSLEMPAFGEALGRFPILDFAPSEGARADGGAMARQRRVSSRPRPCIACAPTTDLSEARCRSFNYTWRSALGAAAPCAVLEPMSGSRRRPPAAGADARPRRCAGSPTLWTFRVAVRFGAKHASK